MPHAHSVGAAVGLKLVHSLLQVHEQRPLMYRVDASLQVIMTADVVKRAALLTKSPSHGNAAPHGHARRHAQSLTTNAQRCLLYF